MVGWKKMKTHHLAVVKSARLSAGSDFHMLGCCAAATGGFSVIGLSVRA